MGTPTPFNFLVGEGLFFRTAETRFFLDKVKAFIFVTMKSLFYNVIMPYTHVKLQFHQINISDQHSSKF